MAHTHANLILSSFMRKGEKVVRTHVLATNMNESLNWNQKYTNAERSNYGKERGWVNEPLKHKCLTGRFKPSCLTPLAAVSFYTDLNLVLWGWVRIVFTLTPCMYRLLAVDLSNSDSRSVGLGQAVSLQEPWTVKRSAANWYSADLHYRSLKHSRLKTNALLNISIWRHEGIHNIGSDPCFIAWGKTESPYPIKTSSSLHSEDNVGSFNDTCLFFL